MNRVQVVLSGFSMRLFCFIQAKTLCMYGCMYFLDFLFITFFLHFNMPSQYIFREHMVLPLYNLVLNKIRLLMYNIVKGLLPEIMSESCIISQ